jgi:hypothetical protein
MSTLYKFDYHAPSGNTYAGYVAADPSTPYAYTAGQTIASNGGTYTIGQPVYTDSTAPAGSPPPHGWLRHLISGRWSASEVDDDNGRDSAFRFGGPWPGWADVAAAQARRGAPAAAG